jgi:hypothetical protein
MTMIDWRSCVPDIIDLKPTSHDNALSHDAFLHHKSCFTNVTCVQQSATFDLACQMRRFGVLMLQSAQAAVVPRFRTAGLHLALYQA